MNRTIVPNHIEAAIQARIQRERALTDLPLLIDVVDEAIHREQSDDRWESLVALKGRLLLQLRANQTGTAA